jgi:hypothetical protein
LINKFSDQDNDAISERDFICPPKRRKQETDAIKFEVLSANSTLFNQNLAAIPGAPTVNVTNSCVEEKSKFSNDNGAYESYFMKPVDLR